MNKTLIFVLILTYTKICGQNHFLGLQGSTSWTKIPVTDANSNKSYGTGFALGINYEYALRKKISINADVVFNQGKFNENFVYIESNRPPNAKYSITEINYNSITVPLAIGFNNGKKVYYFTNIGVAPALLFRAKYLTTIFGIDDTIFGREEDSENNPKFNISIYSELGGGYKINDNFCLFTSISNQHSIIKGSSSELWGKGKIWNNFMKINVGLKFALKKRLIP